ncbi:MAG: HAD family phosphatase [Chloroflexota bacterium]
MTISAIFFDFGGVLLQHADGVDHKAIEERFALEPRTLMRCLYRDSRYFDFQVGKCTHEEWQASIRVAANNALGEERAREVLEAYEQAERPLNPQMLSLIERLRGAGYKTGIISNTIPGLEARLKQNAAHIIPLFDVRIGSGDLGIAKPDAAIFEHALRELDVAAEASVFTDDVKAYAEAASSVGMHGLHFTGYDQFAADLRSIGVDA